MGIGDCGLRNADWGLGIGDWGLGIGDWGLRNADWGLGIADCGLPITDYRLPIAEVISKLGIQESEARSQKPGDRIEFELKPVCVYAQAD
jgi:hypothetical protein